ncbi:cation diffusion facilitator family transporter [Nakamurella aerolata]|uniref:Cation transporter n=1 Tax=Nakamurella aerolata TaxID=1656892 RepID=A0A849A250_9ACTN|nr:cation transporter [Nakamurella aerolata]
MSRHDRDHQHGHDDPYVPGHVHTDGHEHAHGHEHGGGWWSRVRHAASELVGGHSHDAADQVDAALEADARGRRALWISLGALALTALLQGIVVLFTGSVALLGDTMHNVADAATAIPLLIAFWLAKRPPNDRYTYGYGRAEDLAGLFVVAMITLSSVLAAWQAIDRLINPHQVSYLWAVAIAGVIGFAGNELVARYRIRVGRQIGSAALVADGLHARTDGFTSLAVVLGAGGVAVGLPWADPVIGLLIAIAILGVLRSAVKQVGARLMDAVSPQLVATARAVITGTDGVQGVRTLRLRWMGHTLHAEADVLIAADLPAVTGHEIAHRAEHELMHHVPRLTTATIHVSPAGAHAAA